MTGSTSPIRRHPPLILDARKDNPRRKSSGNDAASIVISALFLCGFVFAGKIAHDNKSRRVSLPITAVAVAMEISQPPNIIDKVSLPVAKVAPVRRLIDFATDLNLDPRVVGAVIFHESGGNPKARGTSGERGLMQLMEGTWKEYGVKNPFDPVENMIGGMKYLAWCKSQFGSKYLRCYNGGPKNVDIEQTRIYEKKVMANLRTGNVLMKWLHLPLGNG